MNRYSLLGRNGSTGIYYPDNGIAECRGREKKLSPGTVVEPGDLISIKGEEFVVSAFRPMDFGSTVLRRTQIIQPWDASFAIFSLGLHSGMTVLESGGGSGAMSMYILESIGDSGKLVTVESNTDNASALEKMRDALGMGERWQICDSTLEDYRGITGFGAAMLDLPEPWRAAGNLRGIMANGSVVCTYLPTYNQVEKTMEVFSEAGFYYVESDEITRRRILVRKGATRPDNDVIGHTAFMSIFVRTTGIRN